jgi:hypothetical protein
MNWGSRARLRFPLLLALGLHAALLWLATGGETRAVPTPFKDVASDGMVWLEESAPLETTPAPGVTIPPELAPAERSGEVARAAPRAREAASIAAPAAGELPTAPLEAESARDPAGATAGADLPSAESAGSGEAAPNEGPSLSLEQLGVGTNPFLPDRAPTDKPQKNRTAKFKRALATALVAADQRVGLGPEGPVLKRLEQETRKSDTAASSSARFRATTDHAGRVTSFELIEASADRGVWSALAGRMLQALAGVTLRVPNTGHGVTMDLKVSSEMLLPSGAQPGMGVEVAGIDLKKAGGKNSAKLTLLKPRPHMEMRVVTLPDGRTVSLPYIEIMEYLNLAGDPVDIGKKAQRVVHARLERLWANGESAAPPN